MSLETELYLPESLKQHPHLIDDWIAMAIHLGHLERIDESLQLLEQALKIMPHHIPLLENMALLYRYQYQSEPALNMYRRILMSQSCHASALMGLCDCYLDLQQPEKAIGFLKNLCLLHQRHPLHLHHLGLLFARLGQIEQGFDLLLEAANKGSEDETLLHAVLFVAYAVPGLSPETIFEYYKCWGQAVEAEIIPQTNYVNVPDLSRKLRIGYVSGDFKGHSAIHDYAMLFKNHNRQAFETFLYDNAPGQDEQAKWFQSEATDHWCNISALSDQQVLQQIQQDRIDILVDLSSHTNYNRLNLFAYKPAPIQMTGRGYGSTSGLSRINYRFVDAIMVPPELSHCSSEQLVSLSSLMCFSPVFGDYEVEMVSPPGLKTGQICFGYTNSPHKLNTPLIACWAEILRQVPQSCLWFKYTLFDLPYIQHYLWDEFGKYGIEKNRLLFCGKSTMLEHVNFYNCLDLVLDPFPYNGGISTLEALWMGRPVIALLGGTRVAASILTTFGDTTTLAQTPVDYIAKAIEWAQQPHRVAQFAQIARQQLLQSRLCDDIAMTYETECIYRQVWHTWCASQSQDLAV